MYFDPGFGGMLVQAIVAITAVAGGIVFSFRRKLKTLFSKDKNTSAPVNIFAVENDDAIDVLDNESK